jgi:hypothetical protein
MVDPRDRATRKARGIVEGVSARVTATCSPAGFLRAAEIGERGIVWEVMPGTSWYPVILDIDGRLAWAGDVEVKDGYCS